jgi:hypothetical protein
VRSSARSAANDYSSPYTQRTETLRHYPNAVHHDGGPNLDPILELQTDSRFSIVAGNERPLLGKMRDGVAALWKQLVRIKVGPSGIEIEKK